ncbi:hypothetical protein BDA96_10G108000 [Sorghum bicolor]|uniref:Uncharacterized protein n=1 Tax=Sorghum bicolor TaxID=4558 RepID=A0A921Q367_SORBI|nr:hypothetical protein BDA96_10G108000 [Sorghum bicolor]
MVEEVESVCVRAVERPISFSPSPQRSDEIMASPEYTPQSVLWDKVAQFNEEATALGYNNVIHFGPGVQLTKEIGGHSNSCDQRTCQEAEKILDERRNAIVDSIFVPCEQPILPDPVRPATTRGRSGARCKGTEATRRSSRQMARACSVPVSKRATQRLARAFELVGPTEEVGEKAMEAYFRSFQAPMTDKAIKAVRMLTSLDSGPVIAASAQVLAADGAADGAELGV